MLPLTAFIPFPLGSITGSVAVTTFVLVGLARLPIYFHTSYSAFFRLLPTFGERRHCPIRYRSALLVRS
jgi:hypothetical protein